MDLQKDLVKTCYGEFASKFPLGPLPVHSRAETIELEYSLKPDEVFLYPGTLRRIHRSPKREFIVSCKDCLAFAILKTATPHNRVPGLIWALSWTTRKRAWLCPKCSEVRRIAQEMSF